MEEKQSKEIFIKNKDKILIATDDSNREVKLSDIYESIGENQYLYMMFFNRWGWIMCRLGAIELTKTYNVLDKKYPGAIKVFGFGPDDLGLDEFKSLNIFSQPIFVPVDGFDFYKIFEFKKPGFLKCYGFCNKGIIKRTDDLKKVDYNAGYTFAGDLAQLGGSFIVNKKGIAVFSKLDNFLGDHATEDEIIYQFDSLLRYREFENIEQREESLEQSSSEQSNRIISQKDIVQNEDKISNKEIKDENENENENVNSNEIIKIKSKLNDITKEKELNNKMTIEGKNKNKENNDVDRIKKENINVIDKKDTANSKIGDNFEIIDNVSSNKDD